jgi:hypothetical protein
LDSEGIRLPVFTLYNRIQGRNVSRRSALSDGILAAAMMLLVLDLRISSQQEQAPAAAGWAASIAIPAYAGNMRCAMPPACGQACVVRGCALRRLEKICCPQG